MLRINLLLKDDFLHHTIEYQPVPTYYICFFVSQRAEDDKQKILVDPLCELWDE